MTPQEWTHALTLGGAICGYISATIWAGFLLHAWREHRAQVRHCRKMNWRTRN